MTIHPHADPSYGVRIGWEANQKCKEIDKRTDLSKDEKECLRLDILAADKVGWDSLYRCGFSLEAIEKMREIWKRTDLSHKDKLKLCGEISAVEEARIIGITQQSSQK